MGAELTDELGTLLRRLRKRARLTQEQLAERSTVSVRTIRRLETGKSADHRMTTLHLLADALGVDAEERRQLTDSWSGPASDVPSGGAERRGGASAGVSGGATVGASGGERGAVSGGETAVASGGAAAVASDEQSVVPPPPSPPAAPQVPPAVAATVAATVAPAVPMPRSPTPVLADAAASLASEVGRRWRREEGQRRVHDPFPLPVRWQPLARELTDHPENVQRLQPGHVADGLDLTGDVRSVVDTYRSIASGRLVIIGRAGSGKSILAIRFALDLLAAPEAPARVPVIFSLGSWDPAATTFRDFLIDRLLQDHPHLARRVASGSTLAAALVDADLILPVLDGFDEIAEGLRGPALDALNATSLPLVLTSRRDEYARAVRAAHTPLVWAAGIELTDLTVEDLAAYLPRADRSVPADTDTDTGTGRAGTWDAVLDRLRSGDAPENVRLAEVLRTPLMVVLARTLYSEVPGKDPAELLDAARFPTTSHLEEHLLAGFVPAVYQYRAPERNDDGTRQRNWDPDRSERWLGYLAHSLTQGASERRDLAWWRLGHTLRVPSRIVYVTLVCALCMAVATWLVQLLALPSGALGPMRVETVFLQGALVGLLTGVAFGLAYSLLNAFRRTDAVPSRVRLRLPAADRRIGGRPVRAFTVRFGFMMLGGSVLGVGYAWAVALLRALDYGLPRSDTALVRDALVNMLLFALIFGLSSGLVFGILAAFEAPMDITAAATPLRMLSVNRATVGQQFLVLVPMLTAGIALCGYVVTDLLQDLVGPLLWPLEGALLIGAVAGLGGSTSYVFAFTAWGQWLTLSRVWLPLTGKLPWDTVAFLEDAYRRGVLRQAGAVYQFRHIRLQRHLAHTYRHRHGHGSHGASPSKEPAASRLPS
ncbi:helix-turn-helix domain-containing protein [Streptomyces tritici]|uniref:helix-turn-helix domain-containing protein n=1 Tax=Streptomyces tritici TaxID=2054410 RepID=UPI003AF03458